MDSGSDDHGTVEHSVRIRLTICTNELTQDLNNGSIDSNRPRSHDCQDVEHCYHPSVIRKDETNQRDHKIEYNGLDQQSTRRSFKFVEPLSHKSALSVSLCNNVSGDNRKPGKQLFISPELNQASFESTAPTSPSSPESALDSSSYELIDWEEEKKAIEQEEAKLGKTTSFSNESSDIVIKASTMSQSCNFINWMSATRRRASSVTPPANSNSTEAPKANDPHKLSSLSTSTISSGSEHSQQAGRRASSSDQLSSLKQPDSAMNRSTSGNHLAIRNSVDTICGSDQTQTNAGRKPTPRTSSIQPLEIEIDSPQMDQLVSPFSVSSHPVSLDDILRIDMDDLRFEEECKALEAEAQYWEQKVENLERQQFADDVPRTLVDSIIKHRKELRDLEYEIYKRALDSEESDGLSCQGKLSQSINWLDDTTPSDLQSPMSGRHIDAQMYYTDDLDDVDHQLTEGMGESLSLSEARMSSKFGSHLRPGQENTAEILNAVPPSGSLQRRQYLNKASSGTDTSEYSQLPSNNPHSHRIIRHHQVRHQPQLHDEEHSFDKDVRFQSQHHFLHHHHRQSSSSQHRTSRRHVQQQHQHQKLYIQVDNSDNCPRSAALPDQRSRGSPIRPDHFKSDFRSPQPNAAQDSSSTASSSSSPQ